MRDDDDSRFQRKRARLPAREDTDNGDESGSVDEDAGVGSAGFWGRSIGKLAVGGGLLLLGIVLFFLLSGMEGQSGPIRAGKLADIFLLGLPALVILGMGFAQLIKERASPWPCPDCGADIPRRPMNREQRLHGGGTCRKCGCEVDKRGRKTSEDDDDHDDEPDDDEVVSPRSRRLSGQRSGQRSGLRSGRGQQTTSGAFYLVVGGGTVVGVLLLIGIVVMVVRMGRQPEAIQANNPPVVQEQPNGVAPNGVAPNGVAPNNVATNTNNNGNGNNNANAGNNVPPASKREIVTATGLANTGGVPTRVLGSGNQQFMHLAPADGVLVGFEVGLGKFGSSDIVVAVQPIYRTPAGEVRGPKIGRNFARSVTTRAKPGYAVGGIYAKVGLLVDGMSAVYMRDQGNSLDPRDAYSGDWMGGNGGSSPQLLAGDGSPIIGVAGKHNSRDLTAIGLVMKK